MAKANQYTPLAERLWGRIAFRADGCWEWLGHRGHNGYGQISHNGRNLRVHRFAYELLIGPIPKGLQLDHLCRNRACVNPSHLEPVTRRENILRGAGITAKQARQTQCKHGHDFTPENTITHGGHRACRACRDISNAQRHGIIKQYVLQEAP